MVVDIVKSIRSRTLPLPLPHFLNPPPKGGNREVPVVAKDYAADFASAVAFCYREELK